MSIKETPLEKWLSEVKERLKEIERSQKIYDTVAKQNRNYSRFFGDLKKAVRIIEELSQGVNGCECTISDDDIRWPLREEIQSRANKIAALSDDEVWKTSGADEGGEQ